MRDCIDIFDLASHREIFGFGDALDESIAELKGAGFCLCAAVTGTKLSNDKWVDKTPLACSITYLLAAPEDQPRAKVAVARKLADGF